MVTRAVVASSSPSTANPNRRAELGSAATSPAAAVPEGKLRPTRTAAACRRSTSTLWANSAGVKPRQLRGERQHEEGVDAQLGDEVGPAAQAGEPRRVAARADDLGGVRVELTRTSRQARARPAATGRRSAAGGRGARRRTRRPLTTLRPSRTARRPAHATAARAEPTAPARDSAARGGQHHHRPGRAVASATSASTRPSGSNTP